MFVCLLKAIHENNFQTSNFSLIFLGQEFSIKCCEGVFTFHCQNQFANVLFGICSSFTHIWSEVLKLWSSFQFIWPHLLTLTVNAIVLHSRDRMVALSIKNIQSTKQKVCVNLKVRDSLTMTCRHKRELHFSNKTRGF